MKKLAAVGLFLARLATAFVIAWLGAGATCWASRSLGARLADFTCGHNIFVPILANFWIVWPLLELGGPLIWRAMRRKKSTRVSKVAQIPR